MRKLIFNPSVTGIFVYFIEPGITISLSSKRHATLYKMTDRWAGIFEGELTKSSYSSHSNLWNIQYHVDLWNTHGWAYDEIEITGGIYKFCAHDVGTIDLDDSGFMADMCHQSQWPTFLTRVYK